MSVNSSKLPRNIRRYSDRKIEYWEACAIEHLVDGILIRKQSRKLSDRDLIQLARKAADYVFVHYRWSQKTMMIADNRTCNDSFIKFSNQLEDIDVMLKLLPSKGADTTQELDLNTAFYQEFERYFKTRQKYILR